MKTNYIRAGLLAVGAGGLMILASGCVVEPGRVVFRPPVIAVAPPVVVAPAPEPVMVPDGYTWDGYEYVGLVGDQYFYLGPGNVWLACEPWRLERFQGWERGHPDWRVHVTVNIRYRRDAHGHVYARNDRREDHH